MFWLLWWGSGMRPPVAWVRIVSGLPGAESYSYRGPQAHLKFIHSVVAVGGKGCGVVLLSHLVRSGFEVHGFSKETE
jgi:hypothetical protein